MHSRFPTWYSTVCISPTQERIAARWGVVEHLLGELEDQNCAFLVEAMIGLRDLTEGPEHLHEQLHEADPTLDLSARNELDLLVAVTLAMALQDSKAPMREEIALILACATVGGLRTSVGPIDLTKAAGDALSAAAVAKATSVLVAPAFGFTGPEKKALDELKEAPDVNRLSAQLLTATTRLMQQMQRFANESVSHSTAIREELDLLWWAVSQWVKPLNCHLDEAQPECRPLVAAMALSSITRTEIGPAAIPAIIAHTLDKASNGAEGTLKIVAAAQSFPSKMPIAAVGTDSLPAGLTPITAAVLASRKVDDDSWMRSWELETSLSRDVELNSNAMALQLYREQRLIHLYKNQK